MKKNKMKLKWGKQRQRTAGDARKLLRLANVADAGARVRVRMRVLVLVKCKYKCPNRQGTDSQ